MSQSKDSGISATHRISLHAGIIGCVIVNVTFAGLALWGLGAQSSPTLGYAMFGLSLVLIFGTITTARTIGVLAAVSGSPLIIGKGCISWAMLVVFSVSTMAFALTNGTHSAIKNEATGSDVAKSYRRQIESAQQTIDTLQAQADKYGERYMDRKAKIMAQKQEATQQLISLNRHLASAGRTESSIGKTVSSLEHQLGIEGLQVKFGIFVAIALEFLQSFLCISLAYLTGKNNPPSKRSATGKKSATVHHLKTA